MAEPDRDIGEPLQKAVSLVTAYLETRRGDAALSTDLVFELMADPDEAMQLVIGLVGLTQFLLLALEDSTGRDPAHWLGWVGLNSQRLPPSPPAP